MTAAIGFHDLVGTIRARTPSQTLEFVRPKLASMGITRIARVTGLDHVGIPVSMAVRPLSRNLSVSQGKGYTAELADVSAVMESIEFHHAETPPPAALVGTYRDLAKDHPLIDPRRFVAGWFPRSNTEPALGWVKAENLVDGSEAYIPRALVNFDQTTHGSECSRLFVSTNGLASGNTLAEATCHSLYELIERDAAAAWEQCSDADKEPAEISVASIGGPVRWLLDRLLAADLRVRIWDATSRLGVPTFICHTRGRTELRGLGTFLGMGTHHARDVALSRAVTEAAQSRITVIAGSRDDNFPEEYQRQALTADYQLPEEPAAAKPWAQVPSAPLHETFDDNVADLVERITQAGHAPVLRVDHTKPDLQIPVVHCFVPGMQVPKH